MEPSVATLRELISAQHGCPARHLGSEVLRLPPKGRLRWKGRVHTFELEGWKKGKLCYAWARDPRRRGPNNIALVLQSRLIASPRAAVLSDLRSAR